jgi:single-stranded-DNA-specific exonuclease
MLLAPDLDRPGPWPPFWMPKNTRRRAEEDTILAEAMDQAKAQPYPVRRTLYGPHWHQA